MLSDGMVVGWRQGSGGMAKTTLRSGNKLPPWSTPARAVLPVSGGCGLRTGDPRGRGQACLAHPGPTSQPQRQLGGFAGVLSLPAGRRAVFFFFHNYLLSG